MPRDSKATRNIRADLGAKIRRLAVHVARSAALALACAALWSPFDLFAQQGEALDHYQRGLQLLEQQLWDPAILEFREALKLDREFADAHTAMGIAYSNQDALDLALEAFSNALEITPESADARFNLGLALRNAGRPDEGLAEIKAAVSRDPESERMRLELGLALQRDGLWEESIDQFQEILKRDPNSALAHYWLGIAYQEQKKFQNAIDRFRQAVELDGELVRARNSLGAVLADSGDMQSAVTEFRKAVGLRPDDLELRMNLGVALRTAGESAQAVEQFEFVLDRIRQSGRSEAAAEPPPMPPVAEVFHQLAKARQPLDLESAVADYELALAIDPQRRVSYYGLGQALKRLAANARRQRGRRPSVSAPDAERLVEEARQAIGQGDIQMAREKLDEAVASAAEYAPARDALGFVLGRQGDLDGSIRELTKSVELNPESAESRYHLGVALWYQGRRDDAREQLERAVRLDPANPEACAFLGMAYGELKRQDDARKFLSRAIALAGERPQPYFDLGVVYFRAGRRDEALGLFEAGLNLPSGADAIPDLDAPIGLLRSQTDEGRAHPETHNVLGRLLGRAGADPQQVISEFRSAVKLRPDFVEAHNNLGLALTQTDQTTEAIGAFEEALQLDPEFVDARANLGGVLVVVDADRAVRELQQALETNPGHINAHYNLSRAYNSLGERPKEVAHLEAALKIDSEFARAHFALGKALIAERRTDQAVAHLERAVALDSSLGEARYQLGLALVRAGQPEEARRQLEASRPLISESQRRETATVFLREAQSALDGGEVNVAVDKLRQVVRLAPDSAPVRLTLADALSRQGNSTEAAAAYRAAHDMRPDSFAAALGLGKSLLSTGQATDAIEVLRTAVSLRPSAVEAHEAIAAALSEVGDEESALEAYREVVKLAAENATARREIERIEERIRSRQRAALLSVDTVSSVPFAGLDLTAGAQGDGTRIKEFESQIRQGEFARAEAGLREFVATRPDSSWGHYALGYVLFAQKKIGESIGSLARSLKLNIQNAEAHKILGRVLMIIGQFDRARVEFEFAARLKPASAEIRYNLGKLYSAQDNFPAARQALEQALRLDPSYVEAHNALGFVLESSGLDDEAVASYRKAMELSESAGQPFAAPYVNVAAFYNRKNRTSEALEYASKALEIDPKSDLALFQAAKAYRAEKRWQEAADALEKAIGINARVSRYHYVLGLCLRHLGRADESRAAIETFERLEREAAALESKRRDARRRGN